MRRSLSHLFVVPLLLFNISQVETRIIEPRAMSSGFPLSVRSRNYIFFLSGGGKGLCFCGVFALCPERGILDFIAHGSVVQVFVILIRA